MKRFVYLNGVIDNEIDLAGGIDLFRITTKSFDGISHGGEINNEGDTCEVLENDSSRFERYFDVLCRINLPVENLLDIRREDVEFVTVSECALKEDSD